MKTGDGDVVELDVATIPSSLQPDDQGPHKSQLALLVQSDHMNSYFVDKPIAHRADYLSLPEVSSAAPYRPTMVSALAIYR